MSPTANDQELQDLYERYASLVHARCRRFLKSEDDAWDATQEVFIKLLKALPFIDKKESILSWLISTSSNHCISVLRKKKTLSFDENIHGTQDSVLPQERRLVYKEILRRLLSPWDKKTRDVVIYTYIDGYKQEEIAALTGLGESTIRKYLTKFKRKSSELNSSLKEVLYD